MSIERNGNNEILIRIPTAAVNSYALKRLITYVKYLEAASKSKARQSDADKLADEVNASWWARNKKRFSK